MASESKGNAAVAWLKGSRHKFYEDRYRLLSREVPAVRQQNRGEIFAVLDGIGSAPRGRQAAQAMCDHLFHFYSEPHVHQASWEGVHRLLMDANQRIFKWGFIPGTDRPVGGCAGTIVWIYRESLFVFHAGDTLGLLMRDGEATQLNKLHEVNGAIYRYFGLGSSLQIEVKKFFLEEGDRILLISDGVSKVFHPQEAAAVVEQFDDICRAVTELVHRSRGRGSSDDITALLIEIEDL